MWLSRVWSERHESPKEQNKAFKLLSFSYKKKQNRTHSRRRRSEEEEEEEEKRG